MSLLREFWLRFMKKMLLAYYLPQFHEVEENNFWWGKGFTEWTNLRKSIKYFNGHEIRKPVLPLGEYDLLKDDGVIEKQYNIAKNYGVDGFLVWNYWFGNGEKILEKPLDKVLNDKIKVRYAFTWANHSWLNKTKGILLKEQKYLGLDDYKDYFEYLRPHFLADNYIKINNKPVFGIFKPKDITDINIFINLFNSMAMEIGFDGVYWLAENTCENDNYKIYFDHYLDSALFLKGRSYNRIQYFFERLNSRTRGKINFGPFIYDFHELSKIYKNYKLNDKELGVIFCGWDTSIRHLKNGIILKNFNTIDFGEHIINVFEKSNDNGSDIIVLKSWNEWAEGNILEPDSIFDFKLLNILKEVKESH